MKLEGSTVLITGGTSGLGKSIAKRLLQENPARVYVCGHSQASVEKISKELDNTSLIASVCDVTDYRQVQALVKSIGQVDILINSAGIWLEGLLENYQPEQIGSVIQTNLTGLIYTTRAVLPEMKKHGRGIIVNVSSTSGTRPRHNQTVYAASKWGVRGFTDSLKLDLEDTDIKVIGFYPGGMNTPLFEKAGVDKNNSVWMSPDDVAEILVFALKQPENVALDHIVIEKRVKS